MKIMNRHIFQKLLFLLLTIGCTNEFVSTRYNTLIVQGGEVSNFGSPSRNEFIETLPAGSQLTFYSQGGIYADELLLSYNETHGKENPLWSGKTHNKLLTE